MFGAAEEGSDSARIATLFAWIQPRVDIVLNLEDGVKQHLLDDVKDGVIPKLSVAIG